MLLTHVFNWFSLCGLGLVWKTYHGLGHIFAEILKIKSVHKLLSTSV